MLFRFLCSVQVGTEDINCTSSSHFWKDNKQVSNATYFISGNRLLNQIYRKKSEAKLCLLCPALINTEIYE